MSSRESTAAARVSMAGDGMRTKLLESDDAGNLLRWIALQRKTFTAWANVHLSQRMLAITNLETDLRDGMLLIHLLEILTGQTLLKVKREPKSRIQQLQTVTVALDCLDAMGIRTQGISSFEIVEGNLKIVLGLMWSLVSYFQIQEGGKRSNLAGKRALLVWVKNQVKQYELPVNNFALNFRDGKVLCALVDALHPGELNMKAVMSGANERKNIERALDVAETSLDIPPILEPDDLLAAKPDEMSIMTYVSFFRMKWNKPVLDAAAAAEQRAHLTVRPDRDAPSGTIRRLMAELEADPARTSATAAPPPAVVAPVVVPDSMADVDSGDEEDDEDVVTVESIMEELERPDPVPEPKAAAAAATPPKPAVVAPAAAPVAAAAAVPAPAAGDSLRRGASATRASPNPLAASADAAAPPRTPVAPSAAAPPARLPTPAGGSLRRVPPPAAALVSGSLRRDSPPVPAPAPALRASAPPEPPAPSAAALAAAAPAPAALASPRSVPAAAPAPAPVALASPRSVPAAAAAPAPAADDDAELNALLAEGDAEILRRATALAPKAATPTAATPTTAAASDLDALLADGEATIARRTAAQAAKAAPASVAAAPAPVAAKAKVADLDALLADADAAIQSAKTAPGEKERPKVCEVCMTRKVAAKITPKSGGVPQFLCKPCALDAAAKDASSGGGAGDKGKAAAPAADEKAKKLCDVCHVNKAAARVTLPGGQLSLMCKACTEAQQAAEDARLKSVKSTPVGGAKNPSPLSASGSARAMVRKVPNFVAKPGELATSRAPPQRSTTVQVNLSRQVPTVTSTAQFESSSLRIGKKLAGDLKSRRHFRHSVIVQLPARPAASLPVPTPDGPSESDSERMKSRRLDRTKTRDSLHAAELMAQMEALLAEEGFGFASGGAGGAAGGDDVPPAPDEGPPAALLEENEANRSANARQLATLTTMWFYSDVTREAAEDLLAAEDGGFFVVRPSGKANALALTYKASNGALHDDTLVLDGKLWRFEAGKAGTGVASVDELLSGDKRLAFERTRAWRQRALMAAAKDEEDEGSGEDMDISSRESVIMAPSASLRGVLPQATGGTLSRTAAKAAADAAAAALGEKFSLETPLSAPGPDASAKERERWTLYCDWLAAQNITLEEYAMRVHNTSRDTAARLASEVTLRTVAVKGTDEAAEEGVAEKGAVRAELGDGAREIEIELADMATYVAVADYQSENDNELSFKEGEHVIVLGPDDSGWWKAELNGQFGWVPAAFFERVRDAKAQVATEVISEVELASAELSAVAAAQAQARPTPTSLADAESSSGSSSKSLAGAKAEAEAAAAATAAAAEREPTLAEDGEVMYTQAIEDFLAESEGELAFRRDDYVCVLKPDPADQGGWWKGQLPTGEFGWVPAEFLEVLPAKPKDWANRVPLSKARATVKVEAALQSNVGNEIREMEACEARWGAVAAKFGKLWSKDASPTNVVTGGASDGEWRQRFCVLLKKERRLLELKSWQDEPTAALASHHVSTCLSSTHAARSFAFFVRTRKSAVLLAPIAADKEARIERDEWLAAIASVTKETLKAKRSGGSSAAAAASGSRTKSRSRSGSAAAPVHLKDAVLQGKLQKKSFGWSSRWFALLGNARIQWWNNQTEATSGKSSKGSISLLGAHVGKPPNAGRHHAFYVKTAAESLLLRAKSAEEADQWIAAVEELVAKSNKR